MLHDVDLTCRVDGVDDSDQFAWKARRAEQLMVVIQFFILPPFDAIFPS